MPRWEVLELIEPEESEEHLRGWLVEVPRDATAGHLYNHGDLFTMDIKGWVIGRHARATAVECVYHDHVIHTDPVRGARPDIAPAFPGIDPELDMHFHAMLGVVGLRPEFELTVQAVLENGVRAPMAHMRARHEPLRTGFEPQIRPIVVTCLGRSGTTWLMRMLRHHPEIVVYEKHPYEQTFAKYWMHMLRVLSQPHDLINSYQTETFHNEIWALGYNPFYDIQITHEPASREWFGREYVESLARFCQSSIDSWYTTVARAQGQDPPKYFAEKHQWPNYIPVLMWELYPDAKEIILVRDFRDMAASILAFDRKRGFPGFGRPAERTDEEYMRMELREMALNLRKSWVTRKDRAHLVRYEDLVLQPEETAKGMLEYLELDASPAATKQLLAVGTEAFDELGFHRTSERLEESIGRWRREGDERFRELCNEVFGDILGDFGYSEVGYVG
jgi:Sulfotransferase family